LLDVVICTYNRADLLRGTLDSLAEQTALPDGTWRVLVVDNNCTDHTLAVVSEYEGSLPGLRVVPEPQQGLTEARRRGFLASDATWLAFVDDDCRPAPDWVTEILRFIELRPDAAAFNGFNSLQFADGVRRPWVNPEMFAAMNPVSEGEPVRRGELHGAGLVLRRQAVIRSGWLDAPYVDDRRGHSLVSGGDNALSMRADAGGDGGGLWFVPRVRLDHSIDADRLRLGYLTRLVFRLAESRPLIESMAWPASRSGWHRWSIRSAARRTVKATIGRGAWPDRLPLDRGDSGLPARARVVLFGWANAIGYAVGYARLAANPGGRLDAMLGLVAQDQAESQARATAVAPVTAGQGSDHPRPNSAVVIACYNHGHFLADAIDSVLAQTQRPDEIIVVDDGSTDETRQVVERYPDVCYIHQANQGLSAARNKGLILSSSEVIIFLDADDRLLPEAVEIGTRRLAERPELAFVSGGYVRIDEQGGVLTAPTPATVPDGENYCAFLRANYVGMHGAVAYRRSALLQLGGFDTGLTCCEDYDVFLRLSRTHPVGTHTDLVAEYRTYEGSMSGNDKRMLSTVMALLEAQRPHVAGSPERQAALADGGHYWFDLYGQRAFDRSVAAIRRGSRWSGLRDLAVLIRLAPGPSCQLISHRIRMKWVRRRDRRRKARLQAGRPATVRMGELRRTVPFSRQFGFDRGLPIDRYYIENFLGTHRSDIAGRVLEIGDSTYTHRFGGQRVTRAECLHIDDPAADYQGDLSDCPQIPDATFDCAIVTQTLHLLYDPRPAVASLHRILRPGGVLLVTVPGISQLSNDRWNEEWYWSFTDRSLGRLLREQFGPARVSVEARGNVLASMAFLHGLSSAELRTSELDVDDPLYQTVVCGRSVKSEEPG
jgi:glycosyltransferase involved in cell wall biosynthesis